MQMNFDDTKGKLKTKVDPAAAKINQLHKECHEGLRTTIEKAIACGKLLAAQKEKCGHGKWTPWIEANLDFGDRQVRRYVRCYEYREKLPKRTSKSDFPSIEEFLRLTEEPKEIVTELVPGRNKAQLINIPGQESPLMLGGKPLLTVPQALKSSAPGQGNSKEQPKEDVACASPAALAEIFKSHKDKPFTVDLFRLLLWEIATALKFSDLLLSRVVMENFKKFENNL
jgi:hypothetical protein